MVEGIIQMDNWSGGERVSIKIISITAWVLMILGVIGLTFIPFVYWFANDHLTAMQLIKNLGIEIGISTTILGVGYCMAIVDYLR